MALQHVDRATIPAAFDGAALRADFPVFERPTRRRQAARLPRLGGLVAEAAAA